MGGEGHFLLQIDYVIFDRMSGVSTRKGLYDQLDCRYFDKSLVDSAGIGSPSINFSIMSEPRTFALLENNLGIGDALWC